MFRTFSRSCDEFGTKDLYPAIKQAYGFLVMNRKDYSLDGC